MVVLNENMAERSNFSVETEIGAGFLFLVCLYLLGGLDVLGDSVAGSHMGG